MVIYKGVVLDVIRNECGDLKNNNGKLINGKRFSIATIVKLIKKYGTDEIDKDCLLEDMKKEYGRLDSDSGFYHDGKWISVWYITSVIERCSY